MSLQAGFHKWTLRESLVLKIVLLLFEFRVYLDFSETFFIQMTFTFGINKQLDDT
jgi:hypothetical protein